MKLLYWEELQGNIKMIHILAKTINKTKVVLTKTANFLSALLEKQSTSFSWIET